jgi:hypothetical protein
MDVSSGIRRGMGDIPEPDFTPDLRIVIHGRVKCLHRRRQVKIDLVSLQINIGMVPVVRPEEQDVQK